MITILVVAAVAGFAGGWLSRDYHLGRAERRRYRQLSDQALVKVLRDRGILSFIER